jgi:hypothetical protein
MGIRTPDLLIANETLYQLSYTPNLFDFNELHDNPPEQERYLSIPIQTDGGKGHHSATKRSTN